MQNNMTHQEAIEAIRQLRQYGTETNQIEAKTAKGGFSKKWHDTFSSFSNKYGGIIIFGLSEDGKFRPEKINNLKSLQSRIGGFCRDAMYPPVSLDIIPFEFEGEQLLAAKIYELPQNKKPCYYIDLGISKGSYTRVGDRDEHMSAYEVYALQSYNDNIHEDLRPIKLADFDDLNTGELDAYIKKLRAEKPNFAKNTDEKIYRLSGILDKESNKPTLASILVFGDYPQAYCPQLFVACSAFPGNEIGELGDAGQRFNDNIKVEGTIEQMLAGTLAFLRRNMKTRIIIDSDGKRTDLPEYPIRALREAVANALVHRDYSMHTENAYVQVHIFADRIEVLNPGTLYGQNRIEKLGTDTMMETRNPNIVRLLEEKDPMLGGDSIKALENRHTGIPTMRSEMRKYGLPEPEFSEERGAFKVVFRNSNSIFLDHSSGQEGGQEGGQEEKGPKEVKMQKILTFCLQPHSTKEIAEHLGISSRSYIREAYIKPLLDSNRLLATNPESLRVRNQKYYTNPNI